VFYIDANDRMCSLQAQQETFSQDSRAFVSVLSREGVWERGGRERGREGRAANLRRHIETQVDTNKDGESRDRSQ
jgi:hypothetical protein